MGLRPFSPAWADAVRNAVNASDTFRREGRRWRWSIALVLEAEPGLGYPHARTLLLDLDHGRCLHASLDADGPRADYVLSADYQTWKALVRKQMDPIKALLRGHVRLRRGSLPRLLLHVRVARALVHCAAAVDTAFPDEEQHRS